VFACLAFSFAAQAVNPPPDGAYPGGNTAEGFAALFSLSPQDGGYNTAIGFYSLSINVNGSLNTGVGAGALALNTSHNNTATGAAALLLNTIGTGNTATGAFALASNTIGAANTALGAAALSMNSQSSGNTAIGAAALQNNAGGLLSGYSNTAVGAAALFSNTEGLGNTAVGGPTGTDPTTAALGSNIDGAYNTALGQGALNHNTSGDSNTVVGNGAGGAVMTASNVICVGADIAGADVSNTTWIGNVYGVTTQSGTTAPVVVSDTGQLGTVASSQRFKKDIATMNKASEAVLSLRPVTFHYKADTKGTPQFGLIAEEVAKVNPDLIVRDHDGKPYSVRYDQINAMLLNEFLKEHKKVEEQEAMIACLNLTVERGETRAAQQQNEIQLLAAKLREQAAQIQKVSAQIELRRPVSKLAHDGR
jgi:hypothetical protein